MNLLYSPLPTSQSFRLLEFQPCGGEEISVRLITTNVADVHSSGRHNHPKYDALSYTWVPPLSKWIHPDIVMSNERKWPLKCGSSSLLITENLRDALRRLLNLDLAEFGRGQAKYLFVDAICINQSDTAEKAAQVQLMTFIFEQAEKVIAWLGPEDATTPNAFTAIDRLSTIPLEKSAEVTAADLWTPESYVSKLGIEPLSYEHWLALVAFLHRPFFERVWIVQEMTVAREIFLVCGSKVYPWLTMSAALHFLAHSGWFLLLHTGQMYVANVIPDNVPLYQKMIDGQVDGGQSAWNLFHARNAASTLGAIRVWTLQSLLMNHRYCASTDKRDHLYALLGVARREHRPFDTQPQLLLVDYTDAMTPQRLFTRTARSLFRAWGDLSFLSHKEGGAATSIENLPSWVPDWTVECMPEPLLKRSKDCKWAAAGDFKWRPDNRMLDSPLLDVQGIRIDVVKQLATDPVGIGPKDDWSAFWASLANVASDVCIPYKVGSSSCENSSTSRIEVLWRTLVADSYTGQHPADIACGTQFLSHICALLGREAELETSQKKPSRSHLDIRLRIRELRRRLTKARFADTFSEWDASYFTPFSKSWLSLIRKEPEDSHFHASFVMNELATLQEASSSGAHYTQWSQSFAQFRREFNLAAGRRRLLRTTTGLLGIGPTNMSAGDEIWILAGCSTPVVLRRLQNRHFVFLGEAYVHGGMHGEAVSGNAELEDIVLQ